MAPQFCHQFICTYWHPWIPSTWLCGSGGRLEVSATPPDIHLKECSDTCGPHAPTLTVETFQSAAITFFMMILTIVIAPCFILISIDIPSVTCWSRITICSLLWWPLDHHPQFCNLVFKLVISSLPSDCADLIPDLSSCSDLALQAAVMS